MKGVVAFVLSVALSGAIGLRHPKDLTSIRDEEKTSAVVRRLAHPDPAVLHLEMRSTTKIYNFELRKAPAIFAPTFQMFSAEAGEDGRSVFRKVHVSNYKELNDRFFTDESGEVTISLEEDSSKQIRINGIIGDRLRIESQHVTHGEVQHAIIRDLSAKETRPIHETCQYRTIDNIHQAKPYIVNPEANDSSSKSRAIPLYYTPEVLVYLDYAQSSYFGFNNNSMINYLGVFYNSVNRAHATATTPYNKFVVTGLTYAMTQADQPFIHQESNGGITDQTLDLFCRHLYANAVSFPRYDAAMLHTGYDMGGYNTDLTWNSGLAGIAYIAGACLTDTYSQKELRCGVSEDKAGTYVGIHTVAHEYGHLMGATHDGNAPAYPSNGQPSAVGCPWSDKYIMSYEFGSPNHFRFSSCSSNQFHWHQERSQGDCLKDTPVSAVVPLKDILPGTLITLDAQCKSRFNSSYYFYNNGEQVCLYLYCGITGDPYVWTNGAALEGSTCNTNKWCIQGTCVIH